MIVREDGSIFGTIGGGAVEYKAQHLAAEVLKEKKSYTKGFKLAPNEVADLGMVCGGDVIVYFQFVKGNDEKSISLIKKIIELCEKDEDSWIITDITDEEAWEMGVYSEKEGFIGISDFSESSMAPLFGNREILNREDGRTFYVEPLIRAGRVLIFGGGHVAKELVPVLSHVGFSCLVMDDRVEFSNKEVFPKADYVITGDFNNISNYIDIHSTDYIVIMTRGHNFDYVVEAQALRSKACYIGVIGSKNKTASVTKRLLDDGFTMEDIKRVYTPIGTAIKAESPAEIAISIAGELICVRAEHKGK